jgi:hypothetical protein
MGIRSKWESINKRADGNKKKCPERDAEKKKEQKKKQNNTIKARTYVVSLEIKNGKTKHAARTIHVRARNPIF